MAENVAVDHWMWGARADGSSILLDIAVTPTMDVDAVARDVFEEYEDAVFVRELKQYDTYVCEDGMVIPGPVTELVREWTRQEMGAVSETVFLRASSARGDNGMQLVMMLLVVVFLLRRLRLSCWWFWVTWLLVGFLGTGVLLLVGTHRAWV